MKRMGMVTGGKKHKNNTMTTTINDQHTHHIETSSRSITNRYPSNCISSIWQLASTWQNMSEIGHIAQVWVTKRMIETTSLPANVIVHLQVRHLTSSCSILSKRRHLQYQPRNHNLRLTHLVEDTCAIAGVGPPLPRLKMRRTSATQAAKLWQSWRSPTLAWFSLIKVN